MRRVGRYSRSYYGAKWVAGVDTLVSVFQKLKPVYAQLRKKCNATITTKLRYARKVVYVLQGKHFEWDWDDFMRYFEVTEGQAMDEIVEDDSKCFLYLKACEYIRSCV
jgi:hypothetical protein